ncbi:MAG: hypothetical protein KJ709_06465 [Nanoarchaeota archaeon]|nr:hypothetical protein [Nanoarchaeota archaeon]
MFGKKEKYVRVCPKCKSPDVSQDRDALQQIGILPQTYVCNRCGHSGSFFIEVPISKLKKLREKALAH